MTLEGKKVAILVEDMYEDRELWYPADRLREAGASILFVGPHAGQTYDSKHGYPVQADASADDVSADEFDAVIVPGGYAPDRMRRHAGMVRLVRDAVNSDKVVASICHGGWMLCSADVLHGRRATSFFSIRDDMVHAGCDWEDAEVIRDGNLITSRHPGDLPAFLTATIEALSHAVIEA